MCPVANAASVIRTHPSQAPSADSFRAFSPANQKISGSDRGLAEWQLRSAGYLRSEPRH